MADLDWYSFGDRFIEKTELNGGCWLWTGATTRKGYGRLSVGGRARFAHRVAFESLRGPIPNGLVIDHACGRRECVNPDHLRAVSHRENAEHLTRLRSDNTTGVRGVTRTGNGRWLVQVVSQGVNHRLGRYDTLEEAAAVAAAGRRKYHRLHGEVAQ